MKICTKCKIEKELIEFPNKKISKDGKDSWCKICRKEHVRDYKRKMSSTYSTPRIKSTNKNSRRDYYIRNKEKIKEASKIYRQTEKGKAVKINSEHKRRAMKNNGDVKSADIESMIKDSKICYWCECSLKNKEVHIDHYIPLSKGGYHTLSNLVASCPTCNMRKHAKDPVKFAHEVGKLF